MKSASTIQMLILVVLVLVPYIPSLSGQFLLDDHPYVKNNSFIKDFHGPIAYLSQEDGIGYKPAGEYHSGYYRPLINLTYTLDYKLWGMSPGGFRLTNLILHLVTCLVLYGFLRFFLGGGPGPFWATLLYGLHPVNTETVSWIVSRNNILVTLFSLSSLHFYVQCVRTKNEWKGYLSLLFFAAALLSKEFAIMLVPVFFLYHRLFNDEQASKREEFLRYIAYGAIIIAYLLLRKNATQAFITPGDTVEHLFRGLYFSPWLIVFNLRILFFPYGLHYFKIGYPEEYLGFEAFCGFLGMAVLGWILWTMRKKSHLIFALLSFLIALFPVLNIIPSAAISLVSMRWLYFPTAFLAIAGAWAFNRIPSPRRAPLLPTIIPACLALFLGTYTCVLNQNLWKDERTFFAQEVFGFQNKAYLGDLAKLYHLEGDLPKAYQLFQDALREETGRTASKKAALYVSYASLLVDMGRLQEALRYMDEAEHSRDSWRQQSRIDANRGVAFFKLKNFPAAVRSFTKAINREPENADLVGNLGNAYMAVGEYEKAISLYWKSLEMSPDRVSTKKMLGIAYLKAGNYQRAVEAFETLSTEVIQKSATIKRMLKQAKEKVLGSVDSEETMERGGSGTSDDE